jgi:hypothetical protein
MLHGRASPLFDPSCLICPTFGNHNSIQLPVLEPPPSREYTAKRPRAEIVHARAIGLWSATLIISGLFFLAHTINDGEGKVGLLLISLAGAVFMVALWRIDSIWWAIGFQTAWG